MATIKRHQTYDTHREITEVTTTYRAWPELLLVAIVVLLIALLNAAGQQPAVQVDVQDTAPVQHDSSTRPADARTYAALAVYHGATADDWLQRAAIAQTALNAYRAGGAALDGQTRVAPTGALDPIAWRNALDAVDAVSSGDYEVPLACAQATAVVPASTRWPGAQCVIRDLAFVELPR